MTAHTDDTKTADTGKASGAGEDPLGGDPESLS